MTAHQPWKTADRIKLPCQKSEQHRPYFKFDTVIGHNPQRFYSISKGF